MLVAICDASGRGASMTEIQDILGPIGRSSLSTTYAVFLKSTKLFPDGLDWLRKERNPMDSRSRLLRLTPKGRRVVARVLSAVGSL
jgi:hypothetical protein